MLHKYQRVYLLWVLLLTLGSITVIKADTTALALIKQHEGYRATPYVDATHFSVGYGTNLINGISRAEAELLLVHRLAIREQQLNKHSWFKRLSPTRKAVILDMTYNLGYTGIMSFKAMIWCLKHNYYHGAANRMRDSLWYRQVGTRGVHLYNLMYKGQ